MVVISLSLLIVLSIFGKQINLIVNNKEFDVYTYRATVAQVIDEQNIKLGSMDLVTPQLTAQVKDGQSIKIVMVDKKEKTVQEEIPFNVVRQADDRLPQGIEKVKQDGVKGLKKLVYLKVLHDGVEVSRDLVKTEIIKKSQPKIVAVGKRPVVPVVNRSLERNRSFSERTLIAVTTAYTFTGNNTATGITPYRGVAAVDPGVIPIGTGLYIEGYGEAVALDTGGSIKGNKIDLFFPTREEALNWGNRTVNVHILDK